MIILDFDGVLFDANRFKKDYVRLFRRAGVSDRIQQDAYIRIKAKYGGYQHDAHLLTVKKKVPSLDVRTLKADIDTLVARSSLYLYRDAKPFLAYCKKKGYGLALVSSGYALQKKKVSASGLVPFFQTVVVRGTSSKVAPMRTIMRRSSKERNIFIDDKKTVVDAVKNAFRKVQALQMIRRKNQERSMRADAIVSTLAGARRIIERGGAPPRGARAY